MSQTVVSKKHKLSGLLYRRLRISPEGLIQQLLLYPLRWQCHFVFLAMPFQLSEKLYMHTDFHWIYPREHCAHLSAWPQLSL